MKDRPIAPMNAPDSTDRKITIASDASKFQKRNVIVTGIAFCTEKSATIPITNKKRIKVNTFVYFAGSFFLCFGVDTRFFGFFTVAFLVLPSSLSIFISSFLIREIFALTLLSSKGFFLLELRS